MPVSPGASGIALLSTQTGTGASGVLTFPSIPGTYRELEVLLIGRSDAAATSSGVRLAFNADATANNYMTLQIFNSSASAVAAAETLTGGSGFISIGNVAAANSTASLYGSIKIWVPEYANASVLKNVIVNNGGAMTLTTTNVIPQFIGGVYAVASAITSLTLTLASGNWTTLSRAELWGKAA